MWLLLIVLAVVEPSKALIRRDKLCPPLSSPYRGTVTCHFEKSLAPCDHKAVTGTVAEVECRPFFKIEAHSIIECLSNGTWTASMPRCLPECGKANAAVTLVVNGAIASPGVFPWQAAIYNTIDDTPEFWCGGSLISEYMVITAAHCAWKVPAENFVLAFGKFYREFDSVEDGAVQKIKVARVEMLQSYQDVSGNYNGDLAVLFLERPVELSATVKPVCLDWGQEFMDRQLTEGTKGVVLGWGLTENDTFSDVLRCVYLPVMSDSTCIAQQQRDFKKFVTYTSFCAGFKNGTGVCNGDSGGGLSFFDKVSDRWYLQGLVSVSPRRRGTSFCDPNYYTVFTKVSMFVKWLSKMKLIENDMYSNYVKLSSQLGEVEYSDLPAVDMSPKLNVILQRRKKEEASSSSSLSAETDDDSSLEQEDNLWNVMLFQNTDKILESANLLKKGKPIGG